MTIEPMPITTAGETFGLIVRMVAVTVSDTYHIKCPVKYTNLSFVNLAISKCTMKAIVIIVTA